MKRLGAASGPVIAVGFSLTECVLLAGLASMGCEETGVSSSPITSADPSRPVGTSTGRGSKPGPTSLSHSPVDAAMPDSPDGVEQDAPGADARLDSEESQAFVVDELVNVAPAGPASASSKGVVMVTKNREVLLARLGRLSTDPLPSRSPVRELDIAGQRLASLARGPAIVDTDAYWVSEGKLVRAPLHGGGAPEVLARDARNYTRVATAVPNSSGPRGVAYIATRADDPTQLLARLWIEGHGVVDLSPEGSGASSVALAALKDGWLALTLEGRTGMTPLHARRIRFKQGAPRLAKDSVVWVGGSAQPLTEVSGLGAANGAWAFIAIERDVTHFGLATIEIGDSPLPEAPVIWRNYPNGMDPAPVATAIVCGKPTLLLVQPSGAQPHAPQEMRAAVVEGNKIDSSTVVARGRSFVDVSIAAVAGGALVSYVADQETWALTLRCRPQRQRRPSE